LSREYFIRDALGERQVSEAELPFRIGGKEQGGIVIPGVGEQQLFAFIALSDGHAYIQPAGDNSSLFHNNERLTESAWLKSGDRIQIDNSEIHWQVQGDRVIIEVQAHSDIHRNHQQFQEFQPLVPPQPSTEPPRLRNDDLPVHTTDTGRRKGSGRRRVFIIISALLLAAIYLLTTTPVVIKTQPEAAVVKMKGFPPPLSLWGSRLVFPGRYTIEATYPGYTPLYEQVDIVMGGMMDLSYKLSELPGLLAIKTSPEVTVMLTVDGAEVAVDEAGRAEIARGSHRLRVETDRYLPFEQDIEIQGAGKVQQLLVNLLPAWAVLSISTIPDAAEVIVDGKPAGQTPLQFEILKGGHDILLQKEGFKSVAIKQIIEAGKEINLEGIKLQPVDGMLVLTSIPKGATIMLDGKFSGTTPGALKLSANATHTLQLSKAGYEATKQSVRLKPDEEKTVEVKFAPEYGTVFLSTRPAGATVVIDGRKSDKNNGRLRLTARPHTLTVSKAGYITEGLTIRPRVGVSQNINVELKTAEQLKTNKKGFASTSPDNPATTTPAGQKMQLVNAKATLMMGASRREAGRRANESQRLVKLQRPFYFSRKEVTNGEYRQFRPAHDSGSLDGAALNGNDQPVVNISWDDAARYSNWLSKQQGLPPAYVEKDKKMFAVSPVTTGYRLPTEAEWAWVARRQDQKTEQRYPWLGRFPPKGKVGNYADARIADTLADVVPNYDDNFRGSAPVASFPAWPKGFYDLGGNVAEWMHDYYAVYPGEAKKLTIDPAGPVSGVHHVVRGSSWRHGNITELRLSYRDYSSKPRYDLGFRIARYAR